ncbi:hypothetical protein HPG69_001622 [Diceros bicornis minor]|uniref:Kv channel-interacting protein 4 n=1 Tax=Diceros bicornis minor TaxID=77932 RepID=A0A7J7FG44_DICBM|nr:hypothetical protein HPG69_001622 [Diceros bicornis minor]
MCSSSKISPEIPYSSSAIALSLYLHMQPRSDFIKGLSILLRGTVQEKLNWAFNLYDINKDGYITKEEMLDIMKAIYDMMGKCTYPVLKEDAPRQHVETFFQKMDKNKDGVVTIDEFIESCQKVSNGSKGTIPFAFLAARLSIVSSPP